MDAKRFDLLVRALSKGRATRRDALLVLTGGAFASTGVTSLTDAKSRVTGDRKVQTQANKGHKHRPCFPPGKTCNLKSKKGTPSEKFSCKKCCGSVAQLSAKKGRCCNHEGLVCGTTDQCCLGVCTNGTCQGGVIQLPPPPPPPPPPPVCVALGQPCPAGCMPNEVCPECCAPGECVGGEVCGVPA
jgi:hypothetical protein